MELTLGEDIISRARENWLAVVPFILAVARHQQQSKKVVKQILEQLSGEPADFREYLPHKYIYIYLLQFYFHLTNFTFYK